MARKVNIKKAPKKKVAKKKVAKKKASDTDPNYPWGARGKAVAKKRGTKKGYLWKGHKP
jgi:hypothetical protein